MGGLFHTAHIASGQCLHNAPNYAARHTGTRQEAVDHAAALAPEREAFRVPRPKANALGGIFGRNCTGGAGFGFGSATGTVTAASSSGTFATAA